MQLLSTDEAARKLGLHPETVRRLLRNGTLRGVKIGRVHRVDEDEIAAYVERLPVTGKSKGEPGSTQTQRLGDEGRALHDLLALGARLTANASPLRDDAVRRSYGDDAPAERLGAVQDEHESELRRAA